MAWNYIDERSFVTTAKRSLDVVLHLLPQIARDVREIFRYALTSGGITAPEEEAQFAHQEVLLKKFYLAIEAMGRDRWGLADKYLQEVISESEDVRVRIHRDMCDEVAKKVRNLLDGRNP